MPSHREGGTASCRPFSALRFRFAPVELSFVGVRDRKYEFAMQPDLIPLWAAVVPAVVAAMIFAFIVVRLTSEFRQERQHAGGPDGLSAGGPPDSDAILARLESFARQAAAPDDPSARQLVARASDWLRGCDGVDDRSAYIAACDERFRAAQIVLDDDRIEPSRKMKKLLQLFEPQEPG